MLMLSRRISEDEPESINIHIRYNFHMGLRKLLVSKGIDPSCLLQFHDVICIKPLRLASPTGYEDEIVIGVDAPRHIDIVRSEIDVDTA